MEKLIDVLNLTQLALAELVGLSQGYISQQVTGKREIAKRVTNYITKNYKNVNIGWLMSGDGEMFLKAKDEILTIVEEPGARYEARSDDPTGALRGTLEYLLERVANLEKRVSLLEGRKDES